MDESTFAARVRRRSRRRLAALLILSLVSGTIGAGALSLALFTDSDASTGSFATGTIDIETSPTVVFNVAAMMPGDSVSAALTAQNAGSAQFRYAMTGTNDNAVLAAQMTLAIIEGACGGGGASVYSGSLAAAAFGNPAQGAQGGDRVLAGGGSEVLCFTAGLPIGTGNSFQGQTVNVTFTFDAEQTANNP